MDMTVFHHKSITISLLATLLVQICKLTSRSTTGIYTRGFVKKINGISSEMCPPPRSGQIESQHFPVLYCLPPDLIRSDQNQPETHHILYIVYHIQFWSESE